MTQRNILKHFQQFDVYMVARYQRGCFIHIVNINKRLQSPWDVCARRHGGDWVSVHQTTSEHEARKILARMKQLPDSVGTGNGWWLEVKAISPASKNMDGTSMYKDLESKAAVVIERCTAISNIAGRLTNKKRKVVTTTLGKQLGGDLNAAEMHEAQVNANASRVRFMLEDMRKLKADIIAIEALLVAEQTKASEAVRKGQK
jgi:hypothetical protein